MTDALPSDDRPLTDDERTRAACDWFDYRKDYGVSADASTRAKEHTAFLAGWTARHRETRDAYQDETIAALALAAVASEDRAAHDETIVAAVREALAIDRARIHTLRAPMRLTLLSRNLRVALGEVDA